MEKKYYLDNKEDIEAKRIKSYNNNYDNQLVLTEMKKQPEYEWLKEVNAQSLQIALANLNSAYCNFFKGLSSFPTFHKKTGKQSFGLTNQSLRIEGNKILIPKFREGMKINLNREIEGKIIKANVSKNCSNEYYISITTERKVDVLPENNNKIGIDLGIIDFAVFSNGEKTGKIYSNDSKLKYLNRQLSKKQKGSNNSKKCNLKLSKEYNKINNIKKDYLHKLSRNIINENQIICVEDLNVKGMLKDKAWSKEVHKCSWGEFVRQLEYKSKWYGRTFVKIDRFFPSSKTCHNCGFINQNLGSNVRSWVCPVCGCNLDRDINASINILEQGLNKINCGGDHREKLAELPSLEGAVKQENNISC